MHSTEDFIVMSLSGSVENDKYEEASCSKTSHVEENISPKLEGTFG
jgi:hypothetical protein